MFNTYYNKNSLEIRKLIYHSYMDLIMNEPINISIRRKLTGSIYENNNQELVFKIFNNDFTDNRLSYIPIDITRIGKNKKTSIPYDISGVTINDIDLYDPNIYNDYIIDAGESITQVVVFDSQVTSSVVYDSNVESNMVIDNIDYIIDYYVSNIVIDPIS